MSEIHMPPPPDEALDQLYRAHSGSIYRYALALVGNHVDAEDLTQTTFLNAYRALTHGQRPQTPQAWLRQIATNAFRERLRHDSRRPREVPLHEDSPFRFVEPVLLLAELLAGFDALTPAQRTALVMRELEGRPTEAIAERLALSPTAVDTLISRARRAFSEQFHEALTCQEAETIIEKAATRDLANEERATLRAHLRTCRRCAALARSRRARKRQSSFLWILSPRYLSDLLSSSSAGSLASPDAFPKLAVIAAGAVAAGVPYPGGHMIHRTRPSIQSGTPTVTVAEPSAQPTRTRIKRGAATPRGVDHRFGLTTRPKNQPAGRPNDRSTNPIAVAVPVSTDQTGYDGVTPPGNAESSGGNGQTMGTSSNPGHGGTPPGQAKKTSTGSGQTMGTSANPGHGGTPPGQAKKTSTGSGQTMGTSSNPGHGGTPPGQAKKTSTGTGQTSGTSSNPGHGGTPPGQTEKTSAGTGQNGGNPGDSAPPPGEIADANQAIGQGGGSSQSSKPGHGGTPPGQDKNTNQGADQGGAVDQGASGPPIVAQPGPNPATGNGHGER